MKQGISPTNADLRSRGTPDADYSCPSATISEPHVEQMLNAIDQRIHFLVPEYNPMRTREQRAVFARIRLFQPVSLHSPRKK